MMLLAYLITEDRKEHVDDQEQAFRMNVLAVNPELYMELFGDEEKVTKRKIEEDSGFLHPAHVDDFLAMIAQMDEVAEVSD